METRLALTGDVMLGRLVNRRQRSRSPEAVWGDLLDRLHATDGLWINLECCLATGGHRWQRTRRAFHFRADPEWAIPALEAAGVDGCSLANNHILDFEVPALEETLEHLDEAGIARAGAGQSIEEALEVGVLELDDLLISVLSVTDNTPEYAASEDEPGTAYVEIDAEDPTTRQTVEQALATQPPETDVTIASLHWGPNMRERPPEQFQTFARWLIDNGVDIIHGHSAHVFQGIEIYQDCPILYDTGDFVDDYRVDPELRNDRSFFFEVDLGTNGRPHQLRLLPTEISECTVSQASGDIAEWSRNRMRDLSAPFGTTFEREDETLVCNIDSA